MREGRLEIKPLTKQEFVESNFKTVTESHATMLPP